MSQKKIYKIVPVILAGGTGSRLWPLSRRSFPKQFLNLLDDEYTMLQKTYKRVENLEHINRPIVICNEEHRFIVGHQMRDIDVQPLSGRTVYFDGMEFRHGVSNVIKRDRYTLSMWYGLDNTMPLNKDFLEI